MEDLSRLTCLLKGFYSALNFLIDPFCLSLLEHIQEGIPEVSQPKSEIPGQSIIGNSWYWPTQIGNSRKGLVQFKNSRLANFGISCFGLAHFRNSRFGWPISGIPHLGRLVSGIPDLVLAHQKIFWKNVIFWHVFHSYESLFGFLLYSIRWQGYSAKRKRSFLREIGAQTLKPPHTKSPPPTQQMKILVHTSWVG